MEMMRIFKLDSVRTLAGPGGVAFTMLAVMLVAIFAATMTLAPRASAAKPAYSKSTGYPCTKCHTGTPSKQTLNGFGKAWAKKNL
jgi:hypothetical protein